MHFNTHSAIVGSHALLSASKYHWINYDDDKLEKMFLTSEASRRGTELHALAAEAIRLGVYLRGRQTIALYVNDCLNWKMKPERVLFYSINCYGTADAIDYNERKKILRISDLKTGISPTSVHQLEVYAALFCLEYRILPTQMNAIELRIYQNNEVQEYVGDPMDITNIMDRIKVFDKRLNEMRMEAEL